MYSVTLVSGLDQYNYNIGNICLECETTASECVRECTRLECGSLIDRGCELQLCQAKAYTNFCVSAKDKTLKIKSKGWLSWNRDNVSNCKDISTRGLLFQRGQYYKNQSMYWSNAKRTFYLLQNWFVPQ